MGVIFEKNKLVLAPMVDQSELAWRMLARKYGAQITFTPMMNINQFIRDPKYRKKVMEFSDEDRPLIVQFCGNSPELFAQSAKFVEDYCDGVNLNLGCPQGIARRGHYGSYLQDEWELISSMVRECASRVKVPVSVKIRIFPDVDRTVAYAKMLEAAGAAFIAVHGRTREQNGQKTGLADWEQIRAVKSAVSIPIIANGNILYFEDIEKCLRATKADALMSAEPQLYNPALFSGQQPCVFSVCLEYLDFVRTYPCAMSVVRGHLFKVLRNTLNKHQEYRETLAETKTLEDVESLVKELDRLCQKSCRVVPWSSDLEPRPIAQPHWICQPYLRQLSDRLTEEEEDLKQK
uniref:tRNA-dihydrouridine synthase n=2 Tax=Schistocephalus solidus TaxID=70667 RepID=A0A0X3Q3G7_SCHSO